MFKQRLITAIVLVFLVLFAIYYANIWVLRGAVLLLILASAWEWTQLIPINWFVNKVIFTLVLLLVVALGHDGFHAWFLGGLVLWVGILLAILTFPVSQKFWGYRMIIGAACFFLLPLFAGSLVAIYEHVQGKSLIVYLLFIVWATDVGAYLAGKLLGGHKLIPRVSPGKTVEGALGGFLMAMIVAAIGYFYFRPHAIAIWFVVATATILISMVGDLFISMLKRRSNLKDTGRIFPGHGGVLDRLDSLIAAAPLFCYGLPFLAITS